MILDRNQLVWLAVAEFSIAEIRKPFGEKSEANSVSFFCAKPQPSDLSLILASTNHKTLFPALLAYLGVGRLPLPHLLFRDSTPRSNLVDVLYCYFPDFPNKEEELYHLHPQPAGGPRRFLGIARWANVL